jgi:hypothetical protein
MGIDRIGKGPPPASPETQGTPGTSPKGPTEKTFSVTGAEAAERGEGAHTTAATAAGEVSPTSPLARLQAGEIDVDRYVDLKVEEATRGLSGLSRAELEDIKSVLRDQMVTDPGLSDLVRTATGKTPTPPED